MKLFLWFDNHVKKKKLKKRFALSFDKLFFNYFNILSYSIIYIKYNEVSDTYINCKSDIIMYYEVI